MESHPQNPEFRNNPETFTHEYIYACLQEEIKNTVAFRLYFMYDLNQFCKRLTE